MRAVVTRVKSASVTIAGEVAGSIAKVSWCSSA